jgi:hypothetical protein
MMLGQQVCIACTILVPSKKDWNLAKQSKSTLKYNYINVHVSLSNIGQKFLLSEEFQKTTNYCDQFLGFYFYVYFSVVLKTFCVYMCVCVCMYDQMFKHVIKLTVI